MLESELAVIGHTTVERHRTLYTSALKVGSVVGAGELDRGHAEAVLIAAGVRHLGAARRGEAHRTVRDALDRGEMSPRPPKAGGQKLVDKNDVRERLADLAVRVYEHPFSGRDGNVQRVVLALIALGQRIGKATFTASTRQVSLEAGVSLAVVIRAATKAEGTWLHRTPGNRLTGASSTWSLNLHAGARTEHCGSRGYRPKPIVPILHRAADIWHGRANAWRIYEQLLDGNQGPRDLARTLGLARRTVAYNLRELERLGLARSEAGFWSAVVSELDVTLAVMVADLPNYRLIRTAQYERDRDPDNPKGYPAQRARMLNREQVTA